MIVEIISVGTELLLGDIVNTDVQYLSRILASFGYDVYHTQVVGDNDQRLLEALDLAVSRSDMVITSGGLGATNDDITKNIVLQYVGLPTEIDEGSKKQIAAFFKGDIESIKDEERTYIFPQGSKILKNTVGTSSGAWIPFQAYGKDKIIVILPGPPDEFEPMVDLALVPTLMDHAKAATLSIEVKVGLLGEYQLFKELENEMENFTNPTFAPYVKPDGALVRITAKAKNKEEANQCLNKGLKLVQEKLGEKVINWNKESREETLLKELLKRNYTISMAESLTGGMVASRFVNCPGASKAFKGSFVVYSDEAKQKVLGVPEKILKRDSAVSEKTCRAMLKGLREKTGCDVGIATTGYAGPEGAEVGHVFLGIGIGEKVEIYEYQLHTGRQMIRRIICNQAIDRATINLRKEGQKRIES